MSLAQTVLSETVIRQTRRLLRTFITNHTNLFQIDGTFSKKTNVKKRRHVRLRKKPDKRKKKRVELEGRYKVLQSVGSEYSND